MRGIRTPAVAAAFAIALPLLLLPARARAAPSEYVNTLRGSNSDYAYSRGNTFPAATLPFGFNFWTPITEGNSSNWLYSYGADAISGFGLCHEPSPWIGDHGSLQVMPMTGSLRTDPNQRAAGFSHANEIAHAHYYSVKLDGGMRVEIAPTDHAAAWRFTFPATADAYLLFDTIDDVGGEIDVDQAGQVVSGFTDHGPRIYFYAHVSKAIAEHGDPSGGGANAWIRFSTGAGEIVTMNMATSFLSVDQARKNLEQEIAGKSFDQVRDAAAQVWDDLLGKIEIEGASDEQLTTFYSNLYRAFMYPNSMWEDVDGQPRYMSPYDGQVHDGKTYVNNGFWDTYRAAWPLYELLVPTLAGEMLDGFVNAYKDGGWTPRWTGPGYIDIMVGSHTDIVFADAYAKGITNFDAETAYESAFKNAMVFSGDGSQGRKGNEVAIFRGYIPTDMLNESAAWFLEDQVNDFGLSVLAKALGKSTDAAYFRQRAFDYVNLFSPEVGFFRGKRSDGAWRTSDDDFRPNEWGYEFTEGDPWHYALVANHDPQGMANLYGGREALSAKMDAVFAAPRDNLEGSYGGTIHEMVEAYDTDMGQYAHANEPTHHMIYMYNYGGTPWKAQQHAREVMDRLYDSGLGTGNGYLGDEDNGEMSAWYVFSALGFYPATPGTPVYAIGSPLFRKATVHLENGKDLVIDAPGNSTKNVYVQNAIWNGSVQSKSYLRHADIVEGGTLTLTMGEAASTWGGAALDLPPSPTRTARVPVPMVDVAVDGEASASAENPGAGEGIDALFDDTSATKWLANATTATLEYVFPDERRYLVPLYTLSSGNDDAARDPRDWTLEGSNDGATWESVDVRSGEEFAWRRQTRVFATTAKVPYARYRLTIQANHGAAITQLSELELLARSPLAASAAVAEGASPCAEDQGPERAIDGSAYTMWCAGGTPRTLQIDLGSDCEIDQVLVRHAGDEAQNTRAFAIAVSADGNAWTEVGRVQDNRDDATQISFASVHARHVRLEVETAGDDDTTRIREVEVYGVAGDDGDGDGNPDEPPVDPPGDDAKSGCGCRVAGAAADGSSGAAAGLGLAIAAFVLVLRRRRRAR